MCCGRAVEMKRQILAHEAPVGFGVNTVEHIHQQAGPSAQGMVEAPPPQPSAAHVSSHSQAPGERRPWRARPTVKEAVRCGSDCAAPCLLPGLHACSGQQAPGGAWRARGPLACLMLGRDQLQSGPRLGGCGTLLKRRKSGARTWTACVMRHTHCCLNTRACTCAHPRACTQRHARQPPGHHICGCALPTLLADGADGWASAADVTERRLCCCWLLPVPGRPPPPAAGGESAAASALRAIAGTGSTGMLMGSPRCQWLAGTLALVMNDGRPALLGGDSDSAASACRCSNTARAG